MSPCPQCHAVLPEGARFCPSCGTPLATPAPAAVTERRSVTTLFADLAGYTALGERHDPEDVDAGLRAYFELARSVIEWFGGVVEKYIGDAVVGLFGVPVAHEDDAERAVRAALEIVARMHTLPPIGDERLEVRAAVNTGEALVRLHVLPGTAEGILVGDSVNTAARLLSETPPGCVVAGAATRLVTQRAVAFEPLPPIMAKGKARPVERWLAGGVVPRRGVDTEGRGDVPMVGREVPLAILSGLLDRAVATGSPQFALVMGEAGIGKSRLLREFFRVIDARPGVLCNWRQGHCPPYGDGLAYWALREIVSAHAGISPDDADEEVERKLRQAAGGGSAEDWLVGRLGPLVGLPAAHSEREETLAAWTQFFEGIAGQRPAVIVVEDLHWASEATMEFFLHFARHAAGAPLLLAGTARPEFLEAHRDLFDLAPMVTRIDVKALGSEDSLRLAATLVPGPAAGLKQKVAEGCGGNPLFAEELARFMQEVPESGGARDSHPDDIAAPTSVLALIAARLDALAESQRVLLSDAAVVGQAFWPGALAAVGDRESDEVLSTLEHLEQREFVRLTTSTPHSNEPEFRFRHALMRDVAYERMTRLERAAKHSAVADWLEAGRWYGAAESSELLAHHRSTAYELALAGGGHEAAEPLRLPAVSALMKVAETLLALDPRESARLTEDALGLAGPDDAARARLLVLLGRSLHRSDELHKAVEILEEAEAAFDPEDVTGLASALIYLTDTLLLLGEPRVIDVADRALLLLGDTPSPELVAALERRAALHNTQDQPERAIVRAEAARLTAKRLGLPEPVRAIEMSALANCLLGNVDAGMGGVAKLYSELSTPGDPGHQPTSYPLLSELVLLYQGPAPALGISLEGQRLAEERHDPTTWTTCKMAEMEDLFFLGRWQGLDQVLTELAEQLAESDRLFCLADIQDFRLALSSLTGIALQGRLTKSLLQTHDDSYGNLALSYLTLALQAHGAGRSTDALEMLLSMEQHTGTFSSIPSLMLWWSLGTRLALDLDAAEVAGRLAERLLASPAAPHPASAGAAAVLAEAREDLGEAVSRYEQAALAWEGHGVPFEVGHARLGQGRCLVLAGRRREAVPALSEACDVFRRLGAAGSLERAGHWRDVC